MKRINPFIKLLCLALLSATLLSSCGSPDKQNGLYDSAQSSPSPGDKVMIVMMGEPDNLLPFVYKGGYASTVSMNLFQSLTGFDEQTWEPIPVLAEARPVFSEDKKTVTFRIRNEAEWSPGKPVTANDVIFTYKALYNPAVDAGATRSVYNFIEDIEADPGDPKKVIFHLLDYYFDVENSLGDTYILPEHEYDPAGIMKKFSLKELIAKGSSMANNPDLIKFANEFMGDAHLRGEGIKGSGPYEMKQWKDKEFLVLSRKKDWWGDKVSSADSGFFQAWPNEIRYIIIKDAKNAVLSMKKQEGDVLTRIAAPDFDEMKKDSNLLRHYNFYTNKSHSISFLAMNLHPGPKRPDIFSEWSTRRALALLTDCETILKDLMNGYGERMAGPVVPYIHDGLNKNLKPLPYDVAQANKILDENGWENKDDDGVRYKMKNGKKVRLEFEIVVNAKSDLGKNICLLLEKSVKNAGMKLNVSAIDQTVFQEKLTKSHDFDAAFAAVGSSPLAPDFIQLWHSTSWPNGSNYGGYANPRLDSLIDVMRTEPDAARRLNLQMEIQQLIYDDQPVVFITAAYDRMVIHKRFRNVRIGELRPGYRAAEFWTPKELIKYP